ncbi:ABC transporter permease [Rhodobium gokarnense]|uniref:Uncharacterized protein n=1 Tax=Rhodobium gokarnense TaxID=364296 RepID=A0ABT3HHG8_9HYPH|nr:hypothetical protein [Rhodobium gokarnense]MCW2309754.1 hypothetical protein [Rhodobium gokarnense]
MTPEEHERLGRLEKQQAEDHELLVRFDERQKLLVSDMAIVKKDISEFKALVQQAGGARWMLISLGAAAFWAMGYIANLLPKLFGVSALAMIIAGLLMPTPVAAQGVVPCGDRETVVAMLATRYGETPRALGLASRSDVLEIFVSKGGSWTVLMTNTSGRACMIAVGENWEDLKPAPPGDPT